MDSLLIKSNSQDSGTIKGNSRGMTLIEVMIIIGVLGIVALGITSMMANMSKIRRKDDVKITLQTVMKNLETTIVDDDSWALTIENYAFNSPKLIDCLRDSAPVASYCATGTTATDFNVRASDGSLFYEGEDPNQGFTETGLNCSTYDPAPGAGNDACPFRIITRVDLTCYGAATCPDPKVEVALRLTMNPLSKGDPRFNINMGKFDVDINRNDVEKYEPFKVRHWQTTGVGGGECNYGGWATRPVNQEVFDQGGNVTLVGGGFQLRPGTYKCSISTQSYHQPEGYRIRLLMNGAPTKTFFVANGLTDPNTPHEVTGKVTISISSTRTFLVQHYCPASPAFGDVNNFDTGPNINFHMGFPIPDYALGSSFTVVDCVRSS